MEVWRRWVEDDRRGLRRRRLGLGLIRRDIHYVVLSARFMMER